jgi:hypothetical protein
MPNLDLKGKYLPVPENLKSEIGSDEISYENMAKKKSELEASGEQNHSNELLKWLNNSLDKESQAVDHKKRIIMNTDGQGAKKGGNAFKDTHEKDRDNANPTKVRVPKLHKGKVSRQIMTNKVQYESVEDEFSEIRYLIEYMDNNKTKNK